MQDRESSEGVRLTDEQRIDWLRLIRTANIGPRIFRSLINRYGGAGAALAALPDLARRGGARAPLTPFPRDEAVREFEDSRRKGIALIGLGEPDYPSRLRMIDDAPPLIAVRGQIKIFSAPMIAIVGSRNASAAGMKIAERLARDLGAAGFAIASGLARGIDAAAHRASISTGTVAVMAGGHNHIYPAEHSTLAEEIAATGALLTEMPLSWQPRANDFPRRNRLISGLSVGIVIVEAARRSGSLITARLAAEQGREVFAVPGSPLDPRAEGTNALLKDGVTLVTEAADVINVVEPILGRPDHALQEPEDVFMEQPPDTGERDRIVALLGPTPIDLDDLIRMSGASAAVVRMVLLELEIAGRLERQPGGRVSTI